jgi:hypothetical protein
MVIMRPFHLVVIKNMIAEGKMNGKKPTRRGAKALSGQEEQYNVAVLREGVVMQAMVNTVSAIEYMKNRGVGGATIQRVLSERLLPGRQAGVGGRRNCATAPAATRSASAH